MATISMEIFFAFFRMIGVRGGHGGTSRTFKNFKFQKYEFSKYEFQITNQMRCCPMGAYDWGLRTIYPCPILYAAQN